MSLSDDIKALVSSLDLELYDASVVSENGETIYRVSVVSNEFKDNKRVGVSLDRCVELTHLISPLLDVTPPVGGEYRLEVGSPGIERKLLTPRHFELSVGDKVSINSKSREKIRGTITKVEDNKVYVDEGDEEVVFDFDDITKARTYFEW